MADVKRINGYNINDDVGRTNIGCTEDTYDSSKTYAIDDIVVYEKQIYKCKTAITTPEVFNSAKWQQICLRDLLIYLNTKKQDKLTAGNNITIENGVISASGGSEVTHYDLNNYKTEKIGTIARVICKKVGNTVFISGYMKTATSLEVTGHQLFDLPEELMHDTETYDFWAISGTNIGRGYIGTKTSNPGLNVRFETTINSGQTIIFGCSYDLS